MAERKVDREALVEQIVTLSRPPAARIDAVRTRFGHLDTPQLEEMLAGLRGASARLRGATRSAPRSAAVADAHARRDQALAKLESVSKAIRDRRAANSVAPDTAAAIATSTKALVTVLRSRASSEAKQTLAPSLHYWAEMEDATRDLYIPEMERLLADRVAETLHLMELKSDNGNRDLRAWITEQPAFDHYVKFVLDKTAKDAMRLFGRQLPTEMAGSKVARTFWQHDVALRTAAFDPVFLVEAKPTLTPTRAAEGLAKLALYATAFNTNRIISLGGYGSVGGYLAAELAIRRSRSHTLANRWRAPDLMQLAGGFGQDDRVLMVADIAPPASMLEDIRGNLLLHAPHTQICIVALAGLAETRESLEDKGLVYFPHLSTGRDVTLPWHTGGDYKRDRSSHHFGYSRPSPFVIAKEFMSRVTSSLRSMMSSGTR